MQAMSSRYGGVSLIHYLISIIIGLSPLVSGLASASPSNAEAVFNEPVDMAMVNCHEMEPSLVQVSSESASIACCDFLACENGACELSQCQSSLAIVSFTISDLPPPATFLSGWVESYLNPVDSLSNPPPIFPLVAAQP